ncbi:CDP-diacylglycerol-serine O-phosphatidyltransferase [Porphyromonas crevioricanis JCM 15906]|uniref:CDP-diacylglycerol-serine O-phosphatidyltransferase n=2 Tax=Porphyromonas crevioricanis TaxID=393921 RepID=A0A2X4PMQ0_9PORP|nr:CDP-alcohol phosphatidyltransferase family protein [Porphyromonas crevioricanis]GAD05432.1 CDP-diacylglycerol-serine O-phosphatidyltransferase [Porphyromonas crevioricanis JCM 15906]GAD07655.1 CDP-diacylglycerol-serine O-phosphatidyltransferase [Porphyromonas crevioricanis JCM 13913]SJZ89241.1 CDP-diacylglycerol---serine O-phosphatidyltransferase [Porphyromonas crevioricanis]SQH73655.1 CDP-diacylglycerol-serine O-phosphatidyltransferase [Porphyromonas crevioricanis]
MNIIKHIPNSITCLNLLSGCAAIIADLVYASPGWAVVFIALAALFDLLDGMAARLLHASSAIGADLDSLADVISFGLAPAVHVFAHFSLHTSVDLQGKDLGLFDIVAHPAIAVALASPAFLLAVFAAIRLAKFNNDKRQHSSFIGLPVPANALFWIGFIALDSNQYHITAFLPDLMPVFLYLLLILMSYLMVSKIPMFSFKVKHLRWKDNEYRYSLVIISLLLIGILGIGGLSLAIICYILLSLAYHKLSKKMSSNC